MTATSSPLQPAVAAEEVALLPWGWIIALGSAIGLATALGATAIVILVVMGSALMVVMVRGLGDLPVLVPASLALIAVTFAPTVVSQELGLPSVMKFILPALGVWGVIRSRADGTSARDLPGPLLLIGLFPAAAAISTFGAIDVGMAASNLIETVGTASLAVVIVLWVRTPRQFRMLAWGLLGGSAILAALNTYQGLTGDFGNTFMGFAVSNVAQAAPGEAVRAGGPFGDGNYLSQMVLIGLPMAGWLVIHGRSWRKPVGAIAAVVMIAAVGLSFSRGGLLALAALALISALVSRRRTLWIAVAIGSALAVGALAPAAIVERATSIYSALSFRSDGLVIEDPSARGRINEMGSAILMWRDAPAFGTGVGNYEALYLDYSSQLGLDPRRTGRSAHSLYLETLAETGAVGLLALTVTVGASFLSLHHARQRLLAAHDEAMAGIVSAIGLGFVVYLIAAIFLHDAFEDPLWLLVGAALATSSLGSMHTPAHGRLRIAHVVDGPAGFESPQALAYLFQPGTADPSVQHRAVLVTPSGSKLEHQTSDALPIEVLTRGSVLRGLFTFLRRFNPHVIHVHTDKVGGIGAFAGTVLGIPVVGNERTPSKESHRRPTRLAEWLTVDRVISSDPMDVARNRHTNLVPTELLPEAVTEPTTTATAVRALAATLRLQEGPVLLSAPAAGRASGVSTLLDAFGVVVRSYPTATLLIAVDGPLRRVLVDEIAQRGLTANTQVIRTDDDWAAALAIAHIFIDASWEPASLDQLRDALAAGLLVIATNVGETSLFVDEEFGILINPNEASTLARAMAFAFVNPSGVAQRGQMARDRTLDRFGTAALVEAANRIYRDVADGAVNGRRWR